MKSTVSRPILAAVLAVLICVPTSALDVQRDIIQPAQSYLGSAYCRGGTGESCFDCSGFVTAIFRPHFTDLPRMSRQMAQMGHAVSQDELMPGDLVFYTTGPRPEIITHVAIFMGQDSIIHAISDGPNRGVTVTPLSARYWRTRYHSARRIIASESAPAAGESGAAAESGSAAGEADTRTQRPIQYAHGTYTGELEAGQPHGEGRMEMTNGDVYVGDFQDGVFHGQGEYRWTTGIRYTGQFADGTLHGEGRIRFADGSVVEGRWESGELQGDASGGESPEADRPRADDAKTYNQVADSPWDTYDGIVEGDFYAWLEQEQSDFEQWQRENQP
jgi:hypothetical protein